MRPIDRGRAPPPRLLYVRGTPVLLAAVTVLLAAVTVFVAACYTGPAADHFVGIVDSLSVPDDWQVAKTIVRGPDQPDACRPGLSTECPGAIRFFVTRGDLESAYGQAKNAVAAAGLAINDENTSGCSSGSGTGPPCGFFAERETDHLYVGVYASPSEAGLGNESGDGVVVVVRVSGSG